MARWSMPRLFAKGLAHECRDLQFLLVEIEGRGFGRLGDETALLAPVGVALRRAGGCLEDALRGGGDGGRLRGNGIEAGGDNGALHLTRVVLVDDGTEDDVGF